MRLLNNRVLNDRNEKNKNGIRESCDRTSFVNFPFPDEAPDTGDDSDEDLITSYLGVGGTNGGVAGVPSINVTSAAAASGSAGPGGHHHHPGAPAANANHILEDNLMQLAEIQENIQRMRMENAADSHRMG